LRILGIDCGSRFTGYGVIESDGGRHTLVDAGVIETNPREPLAERLKVIGLRLREIIAAHSPGEAAVEATFHAVNTQSALKLTHVRGVALFVLAEAGVAVGEYSPAEVKMSVVGSGRAEKEQVQWMVRSLLGLDREIRSLDASDAVAVAICHAVHRAVGVRR
jgi:crossover junction endodeoxyribonuclease RuvC